jgi:hypothetical protein
MPFNNPPLLILSYPRSGSSWVGRVLATSSSVAYLREPITQQYIFKHGGRFALVDLNSNPLARSIYRKLGDEVFNGIPPQHPDVVNDLGDYVYPRRQGKRIMIKEVNPRAVSFYCDRYKTQVLLLLRHPAAVALSFYRLGWLDSSDAQMETNNPNASIWEQFGYAYGAVMHNAIHTLQNQGGHTVMLYRQLAENPHQEFKDLFASLELEKPANFDAIINRYCYAVKDTTPREEIERTSKTMVFKWKDELTDRQISDLRTGFLQSKIEYYRDAVDWEPLDHGANS